MQTHFRVHARKLLVDRIAALLLAILVIVMVLILGGVFAEPITLAVRRRFPGFSYEGDTVLLVGLLILAAFTVGLVVMYLLLRM
jgi:hypothetical protein